MKNMAFLCFVKMIHFFLILRGVYTLMRTTEHEELLLMQCIICIEFACEFTVLSVCCVFTGMVSRELCEQQEYGAGVGGSSSAQRHLHQGAHTHTHTHTHSHTHTHTHLLVFMVYGDSP